MAETIGILDPLKTFIMEYIDMLIADSRRIIDEAATSDEERPECDLSKLR